VLFFFQAEDGIRDFHVTGVQTCALPISIVDYLKVPPEEILIAHDELDLPIGEARFKFGGGHGGHNGLRDVITHIGNDFWRLRIEIGRASCRERREEWGTGITVSINKDRR